MENLLYFPSGKGGTLTPEQVQNRYFEFFKGGSHREVLLLGELQPLLVHYIKSKRHKVLCGAAAGRCQLCDLAAESADIATRSHDYLAPAAIRIWRERKLAQKVAVFTQAAKEKLLKFLGDEPARGKRFEVRATQRGTSRLIDIKLMPGLPEGFPAVMPKAFDLLPFIRGRFGRPMVAGQEPVFFEPIEYDASVRVTRELQPLALSAADCTPTTVDVEKIKAKLGVFNAALAQDVAAEHAVVELAATPAPPSPAVPAVDAVTRGLSDASVDEALGRTLKRFPLAGIPAEQYAPKVLVQDAVGGAGEAAALAERTGQQVCREEKERSPLFKANGRQKGGVQ